VLTPGITQEADTCVNTGYNIRHLGSWWHLARPTHTRA